MEDFLVLGTFIPRVLAGSAHEAPTIYQGERVRGALGNLFSMEAPSTGKRVLECQVDLYEPAEEAALKAQCVRGVPVTISGWWAGTPFSGVVDIGDVPATAEDIGSAYPVFKTVALHIEEV